MDANTKKRYDKAGPQVVKALEKRHFEAYYVSTAAEAVEKVVELIPKEHTVSWGGTATVDALGIKQRLAQEGIALIDRDTAQTPQERQEMLKKALTCGTFLMSSNAISADGQLVNIDGTGNRVALCASGGAGHCGGGHEQGGRRSGGAMRRAREVAAPVNAQRFAGLKTPCSVTGLCADCTGLTASAARSSPPASVARQAASKWYWWARSWVSEKYAAKGKDRSENHSIPSGEGCRCHPAGRRYPAAGRAAGHPHGDGIRSGGGRPQRDGGAPYFRGQGPSAG
ncbi:MAG: lactate utilization protein [Oscillospiraceae bacterium]